MINLIRIRLQPVNVMNNLRVIDVLVMKKILMTMMMMIIVVVCVCMCVCICVCDCSCCWLFVTMIKVVMMTMLMVISVIVFVVIFLSYLELYIFSYKNVDRIYEQVCNYSWDPL